MSYWQEFCSSSISTRAILVLAGGRFPRAAPRAAPSDGPSRPVRPRAPDGADTSHDDGNYLLYVSVDTVIRGLITRTAPHVNPFSLPASRRLEHL